MSCNVFKDMTGEKFGHWLVLSRAENGKGGTARWLCVCECGTKKTVYGNTIRNGTSTNCGCLRLEKRKEYEDLSGKIFGRYTVLERDFNYESKCIAWLCECSCGSIGTVQGSSLKNGTSKSCGCLIAELTKLRFEDLSNKKFNRLLVLSRSDNNKYNQSMWKCLCDCGNEVIVRGSSLGQNETKSCGCLNIELTKSRTGENHPRWTYGKYSQEERERHSDKNKEWRFNVFEKDSFTCQKCKDSSGGNLNAHHLKSFIRFPEFRFITENGVTLCVNCHREFHSIFGTKDFTSSDYFNWLKED